MAQDASQPHFSPPNDDLITPRRKALSVAALTEIEQRRTYTLQGILNSERKGKLFEHFIVTGLPPQVLAPTPFSPLSSPRSQRKAHSRNPSTATSGSSEGWTSYNPEILYCYPESPKVKKLMVQQFTFPQGMSSDNVRRLATEIEMNQLVFAPLSTVEESNSSFVFLLTTEDALLYGVCVLHEELLRDHLSFAAEPEAEHKDISGEDDGGGFVVAPRCYMFLTKYPFFSTHFQVLYSLLAQERTHRMFARMNVPHESEVRELLEKYWAFDVPTGETTLDIRLREEPLKFLVPAGEEEQQLIEFCLACLLKLLTLDQLLIILAAALQECQVLIISHQTSIISALVMAMIPLMRPYVWQGTFIPVIPSSLDECMHSPMPYIMGVQELPDDALEMLEEVIVIDVDAGELLNVPGADILTPLPYESHLRQKLQPLHDLIHKTTDSDRHQCYLQPYSNSRAEIEICHCVLSVLRNYHRDMHHTILRAIDNIPRFNLAKPRHITKLIVEVGDDNYTAFLKRFLTTQHWHFFFDNVKLRDDSIFSVAGATIVHRSDGGESEKLSGSQGLLRNAMSPAATVSASSSFADVSSSSKTHASVDSDFSASESQDAIAAINDAFDSTLEDFDDDDDM